mmetsp:Transcript_50288/g.121065  ORF Transcript_50288/g.121065 Transcript_50288/m.121065 type:complete len:703 (+) Transcript_50288:182-2290(+)
MAETRLSGVDPSLAGAEEAGGQPDAADKQVDKLEGSSEGRRCCASKKAALIAAGGVALLLVVIVGVLAATGTFSSCAKKPGKDSYDFVADSNGDGVTCTKNEYGDGCFGVATACGSTEIVEGPALAEPTELVSTDGALAVALTVEEFTLDAGEFTMRSRGFCLDGHCAPVGPTLRAWPGDTVTLNVTNNLPVTSTADSTSLVNVHTHGLHVDPSVDNVYVTIPPGATHTYEYRIGADHAPGTHWYHDHTHGVSALHVAGGLLGGIIIDPPDDASLPASYEEMESRLLVFTHLPLCSCNPTNDPFRIVSMQELRFSVGDTRPLDAVVGERGVTDVMLTNGQFQPQLELRPGQWVRLETVNAVGDVFVELEVRSGVGIDAETAPCSMKLLALDGVPLRGGSRDASFVALAPAARASIAVMCEESGTFYLQTVDGGRAADSEALFQQNLVTLAVNGEVATMDAPEWGAGAFPLPAYFRDLRDLGEGNSAAAVWQIGVEQGGVTGGGAWLGVGADCALEEAGRGGDSGDVDANAVGECPYLAWGGPAMPYRHHAKLCDVVEVTLQGRGRTPHPVHIHVNHFQVVALDVGGGGLDETWGQIGDWRDTMPALTGAVTLRYAAATYGGVFMSHCHFLWHEDLGMMDRVWVEPEDSAVDRCTASGLEGARVMCGDGLGPEAFAVTYDSIQGTCEHGFTVRRADGSFGKLQ